jgi:hypothetical protein
MEPSSVRDVVETGGFIELFLKNFARPRRKLAHSGTDRQSAAQFDVK